MSLNLSIKKTGLLLVAVPFVCELAFVVVLAYLHWQAESEVQREIRSKTIIEHSDVLMVNVLNAAQASSTYALNIHDPDKLAAAQQQFEAANGRSREEFDYLQSAVRDKPDEAAMLSEMREVYTRYQTLAQELVEFVRHKDEYPPLVFQVKIFRGVRTLNDMIKQISGKMNDLISEEKEIEIHSPQARAIDETALMSALCAGLAMTFALAVVLANFFGKNIGDRLNVIDQNTFQLAKGLPLKPRLEGKDEIAHVDSVFHDMAAKLKEADRLKQEFVGIISHELRTPLTSIQALLTLLEAGVLGELPDKSKSRIRGAEADVERLIKLINELLDIEKMESGRLDMTFAETKINDILARSTNSVRMMAEKRKVAVVAPEDITATIVADGDRLVQVLVNLLSNAVKFSPEGGKITVSCAPIKEKEVEFRVQDQGRGIPPEFIDSVFDRYKQVEINDSRQKGGTGLGLAICKAIIEQHGGRIGVTSKEGEGSTFWFRVPLIAQDTQPVEAPPAQPTPAKRSTDSSRAEARH
ncbi:MAG TPA: HAMP domain-containing sensor histidine kinase [Planktothrix sp.]|jgi:signal transduction histidine kinase